MLATKVTRSVLAGVLTAGALALAQPALAADYCVAPNDTCGGIKLQDFQAALDAAAVDAGPDRIFLGTGTYTAPAQGFIYDPMNAGPVELVGAGRSDTVLAGTSGGIRTLAVFGGPQTSVHTMRIVMPPNAAVGAQALRTDGVVSDVSVVDNPSEPFEARTGVVLLGSAVLQDSFVGLSATQPTLGVSIMGGGTVRNSGVDAHGGIGSNGGTIDRVSVSAPLAGISVGHGTTKITSSRIRTTDDGSVAIAGEGIDGDTSLEVDGVTMVGPGAVKFGTGVSLDNAYAATAGLDVVLRNSIIRGYPSSLWIGGTAPGHVHVAASYSDYDSSSKNVLGVATLSEANISYVGEQGFSDEGDYVPLAGSPLVDAGDPATGQGLDEYNAPLVTDGDGDGVARRDVGAAEQPGVPPRAPAGVAGVTPASGAGQPADAPVVAASRDILAPTLSGLRLSRKVFAVGRARTAVSARTARGARLSYTLSESAKVVIQIRRVGARHAAGKLIRAATAGRNAIKFSGRIGAKVLKPGRYRALITASDAAGNRSSRKSIGFRIVKR